MWHFKGHYTKKDKVHKISAILISFFSNQVIYSLLRLNGILRGGLSSSSLQATSREETEMQVASKDLRVFPEECLSERCSSTSACEDNHCHLCKHCVSTEEAEYLRMAFMEHVNRHQVKRIFPSPMSRLEAAKWKDFSNSDTPTNVKMKQWFAGKCLLDEYWCN